MVPNPVRKTEGTTGRWGWAGDVEQRCCGVWVFGFHFLDDFCVCVCFLLVRSGVLATIFGWMECNRMDVVFLLW